MFTLIRNNQRRYVKRGKQKSWHSFLAQDPPGVFDGGFGLLVAFDELMFPPGDSTEPHCDDEAELLIYVYKGALSQEDTAGNSGVIHAGEFQHMSTGRGIRHKETSVSQSDWVHLFRMSLQPLMVGIDREHEQKRFTAAERRNVQCIVASYDGRKGSLRIHQHALIYSTILESGHHLVYELESGHSAWLHIVHGKSTLNNIILTQGDGVGTMNESAVSLTAQENTELLLVDLGTAHLMPC